jgi:hypothetical protein
MDSSQKTILSLIREITGQSDIVSIEYKDVSNTTKDRIDFKKARGSVRLMSRKIKTNLDVESMVKSFLALQIP